MHVIVPHAALPEAFRMHPRLCSARLRDPSTAAATEAALQLSSICIQHGCLWLSKPYRCFSDVACSFVYWTWIYQINYLPMFALIRPVTSPPTTMALIYNLALIPVGCVSPRLLEYQPGSVSSTSSSQSPLFGAPLRSSLLDIQVIQTKSDFTFFPSQLISEILSVNCYYCFYLYCKEKECSCAVIFLCQFMDRCSISPYSMLLPLD